MTDFNYDAPQYIDFDTSDLDLKEYGDEYFEMDHETKIGCVETEISNGNIFPIPNETNIDMKTENKANIIKNEEDVHSIKNLTTTDYEYKEEDENETEVENEIINAEIVENKENINPVKNHDDTYFEYKEQEENEIINTEIVECKENINLVTNHSDIYFEYREENGYQIEIEEQISMTELVIDEDLKENLIENNKFKYREEDENKIEGKEKTVYREEDENKIKDKEQAVYGEEVENKIENDEQALYKEQFKIEIEVYTQDVGNKNKDKEQTLYREQVENKIKNKGQTLYREQDENKIEVFREEVENKIEDKDQTNAENVNEEEASTANQDPFDYDIVNYPEEEMHPLRKSMSTGNIIRTLREEHRKCEEIIIEEITNGLEHLQVCETRKIRINGVIREVLPTKLQLKPITIEKRLSDKRRSFSRDALNKHGQIDYKLKCKTPNGPNKFISLAEAVNKFHFRTPQRFHTKSSKENFQHMKMDVPSLTKPQSPQLATKVRSRPTVFLTRQEQEQIEADEIKNFKIKARPVNYKILHGPALTAKVDKKPCTLPKPFKLTEVKTHKPVEKEEVFEFHARPAPKAPMPQKLVFPICGRKAPNTIPKTKPTSRPRKVEDMFVIKDSCDGNSSVCLKTVELAHEGIPVTPKLKKTKIEAFSFEERNRILQQRKEEKIRQFLEEEKRAREFHARPIPPKILSSAKTATLTESSKSKSDENVNPMAFAFKARRATVIHQKPFVPKHPERPLSEINEFNFNTTQRAKVREEFEKKLKDKEEMTKQLKKQHEQLKQQLETEEVAKFRKEAIHKANPIKHYKLINIAASTKQLTSPKTPQFMRKRKERNESETDS